MRSDETRKIGREEIKTKLALHMSEESKMPECLMDYSAFDAAVQMNAIACYTLRRDPNTKLALYSSPDNSAVKSRKKSS